MSVQVTEEEMEVFMKKAIQLAKESGKVMKEAFYKKKSVIMKTNFGDLVTETDSAIEKSVMASIKESFPEHRFIGEETAEEGRPCEFTDLPTWILDPIDGTTNFIHSIPDFCFSLGLTINREPVLGVVYLPIGDKLYTAIKGQGAFCNSNRLSVSANIVDVKQAVVMSEGGNHRDKDLIQVQSNNVLKILTNSRGLRAYGSTAIDLCHLASGEGEVYVQYDIHCWDMAAGVIIAREAGASVMDPTGAPLDLMSRRVLAASSETLAKQMSSLLTHVTFGRD